jgi:hypothetical protein
MEEFDLFNAESRPGDRICDCFTDQIRYYFDAPAKKSPEFRQWFDSVFKPRLEMISSA